MITSPLRRWCGLLMLHQDHFRWGQWLRGPAWCWRGHWWVDGSCVRTWQYNIQFIAFIAKSIYSATPRKEKRCHGNQHIAIPGLVRVTRRTVWHAVRNTLMHGAVPCRLESINKSKALEAFTDTRKSQVLPPLFSRSLLLSLCPRPKVLNPLRVSHP